MLCLLPITQHHPSARLGLLTCTDAESTTIAKAGLTLFFASSNCSVLCFILFGFWLAALQAWPAVTANTVPSGQLARLLQRSSHPLPGGRQRWGKLLARGHTQTHTERHVPPPRMGAICNVEIVSKEQQESLGIKA